MFDWAGLENALSVALLAHLEAGVEYRAAALAELYAETGGIITAPLLYLNTDGKDMDSPPDWEIWHDDWSPTPWIEALTAEACSGTVEHWEQTFTRFQDLLARICSEAGARAGLPVFFLDHSRYEELLQRSLTPAQLRSLFPEVVAAKAERLRLAALPLQQRISYYVSRLDRSSGLITSEEAQKALRDIGSDAIPALLPLLRKRKQTWRAAMLLAEIGVATPEVIDALSTAMLWSTLDSPGQLWSCRALAQLGRLDVVLKAAGLSQEARAIAVTAPYTAFRDRGRNPLPLNYSNLSLYAGSLPRVESELAPGTSYCVITAAEVPEAIRGTTSPHAVIRKHAVCVLGDRRLGEEIGRQVIPLLRTISQSDPDSEVRRLAGLSLRWWNAEA
jgi:hypothetical protein